MNPNKRNYRVTFVIDHRGKEETLDQIVEELKQEIAAIEGEVIGVEDLGKRDFVRVTDRKFTGAPYFHLDFSAPPTAPTRLKERLRLNANVYRTFIVAV
jgi:small subunit ribosomal protein S6